MTNVSKRNQSMDILRILACLGVIVVHVYSSSVFAMGYVERGSREWLYCYLLSSPFSWVIPAFVMITGFFFLNPKKSLPLKKLYGRSILRLALSLVFWTWFYAIILKGLYTSYYPFGGQENNFWYVGMCIGLYISMPVLRSIAANDKLLSYFCWMWLLIRLYYYIGNFVELPIVFTDYVFFGYIGYCMWGYYLTRIKTNKRQTRIVYFIGLLFFIITKAMTLLEINIHDSAEDFPTILVSIAVFLFVIKHPIELSPIYEKLVTHLSGMTFGIYMVHTFVIIESFTRIHRFIPNIYLLVPVSIIATFVFSYIIILIVKQIPVLKKWVI